MNKKEEDVVRRVQAVLTPGLRKGMYRNSQDRSIEGHCYHAGEAVFHLLGGRQSGYVPHRLNWGDGSTHWYLVGRDGEITDPTIPDGGVPYDLGDPKDFYTTQPSRRATEVIQRMRFEEMLERSEQESAGKRERRYQND